MGKLLLPTLLVSSSLFCSVLLSDPTTPKTAGESGITGEIVISPIHGGPSRIGVPDSKPLAHIQFVVSKENSTVTSFQTDDKGRFRISLPPGHYTVSAKEKASLGSYGPFEVDVAAGEMKHVRWDCDSGIR